MPGPDDVVVISYKLLDLEGRVVAEVDETELEINDSVQGVREVITRMPEGSRWRVAIPAGATRRRPFNAPLMTLNPCSPSARI